jgi:VWFA-related protein
VIQNRHALTFLGCAFALLLASPRARAQTAEQARAAPVELNVTVTDARWRLVTGLTRESFLVYENKSPREIVSFGEGGSPLSVGIVFDVSASVTINAEVLDEARRALLDFARRGGGSNEYFVIGFNKASHLLADWTRDPAAVAAGLSALTPLQNKGKDGTVFYDAVHEALGKFGGASNAKRVLLVVSDGADHGSRHKSSEVRRMAAAGGVLVYALGVYRHEIAGTGPNEEARRNLSALCRASGGRDFYLETFRTPWQAKVARADPAAEVKAALETITLELSNQYLIRFRPSPPSAKPEWRRVEVRVRAPGITEKSFPVRAREGYVSGGTTN